jgi:hypothetical protein
MGDDNKSQHVFNASSNLLGICFVVLTSLKVLKIGAKTIIDEITIVAIMLFMAACILSFLSLRNYKKSAKLEAIADYVFLSGLALLFLTALLFSLNVIT